ncbi:hypothetical protein BJ166DRAFT_501287 [Pestalotiopsis sp. NC0098]|nr:hypothetical protein BJ166DRAFT_501287 [Pestalotiopsis sp. NC0098]
MTTTVVGAAFFSAIMAMRKHDPERQNQFPRIDVDDEKYKGALLSVAEPAIVGSVLCRVMNQFTEDFCRNQFPPIDVDDEEYKGALSSVAEPAIVGSVLERVSYNDLSGYVEATTGEILDLAQRAVYLSGFVTSTWPGGSAILWKCQTCDTIRCGNCKGNPKHEYEKLEKDARHVFDWRGEGARR